MMVIQDLTKAGHHPKFKRAVMPIHRNNHSKDFFLQNHKADLAIILDEADGALPCIK